MQETVNELQKMVTEHSNRHKVDDKILDIKKEALKLKTALSEVKNKSEKSSGVVQHTAVTHHFSLVLHLSILLQELSKMQTDAHSRHTQYLRKELIITGKWVSIRRI